MTLNDRTYTISSPFLLKCSGFVELHLGLLEKDPIDASSLFARQAKTFSTNILQAFFPTR